MILNELTWWFQEEGWLMGIKEATGRQGLFPANFTRPIWENGWNDSNNSNNSNNNRNYQSDLNYFFFSNFHFAHLEHRKLTIRRAAAQQPTPNHPTTIVSIVFDGLTIVMIS